MEPSDLSDPWLNDTPAAPSLPRITLFTMFRLGLFQMGLGMMSLLTLGVLNRVMITELKVPVLITGGAIAVHQFMSPSRVWFGQLSDAKPIFGQHRTGYVWLGTLLFTLTAFLALQVTWQLGSSLEATGLSGQTYAWIGVLGLMFALYGLALGASSTPFAAMLVDISDEDNRSKLVSIVWSLLMVGIIIGAILTSILLKQLGIDAPIDRVQTSINRLFVIVPAIVITLAVVATWGVEKKYSRYTTRSTLSDREDQISLGRALRVLTASRQTGIFFTFLLIMSISLFMQDAILENYGGQVFKMPIAATTQLNAFFGLGTLIGIASTGFLIVPRLGKKRTVKYGCLGVAICCGLLVAAGFTGEVSLLKNALLLFGVCAGVLTAGAIGLMLDLTAAETAGTFIGAWGLAQAMARGLATVFGTAVLALGQKIFSQPVLAYGLVFVAQIMGMLVAVWLLRQVNIKEFQENTKAAIAAVMAGDLD